MSSKRTTARVNGVDVPVEVEHTYWGWYVATKLDWDEGMPLGRAGTQEGAIADLVEQLEQP